MLLALLLVALAGCSGTASSPAPSLADPNATATTLVTRYFELLKAKDTTGLGDFLAPAFQLQRADGSGATKAEFIANGLPSIDSYTLADVAATQGAGTLVVRYTALVSGTTNGKAYTNAPAPRFSVFSWDNGTWRLIAHGNFNPLQ